MPAARPIGDALRGRQPSTVGQHPLPRLLRPHRRPPGPLFVVQHRERSRQRTRLGPLEHRVVVRRTRPFAEATDLPSPPHSQRAAPKLVSIAPSVSTYPPMRRDGRDLIVSQATLGPGVRSSAAGGSPSSFRSLLADAVLSAELADFVDRAASGSAKIEVCREHLLGFLTTAEVGEGVGDAEVAIGHEAARPGEAFGTEGGALHESSRAHRPSVRHQAVSRARRRPSRSRVDLKIRGRQLQTYQARAGSAWRQA